jgi:sialate O-acetylesterase
MKSPLLFAVLLTTAALIPAARPAVTPNVLFSDNAVLQQGREVPVWGSATDGERVTVKITGQEVATTAQNGRWLVRLKPLPVGGPYTMTISGANNAVTISNLLVGEVWICSGQSNMERHLGLQEGQKPITNWQRTTR